MRRPTTAWTTARALRMFLLFRPQRPHSAQEHQLKDGGRGEPAAETTRASFTTWRRARRARRSARPGCDVLERRQALSRGGLGYVWPAVLCFFSVPSPCSPSLSTPAPAPSAPSSSVRVLLRLLGGLHHPLLAGREVAHRDSQTASMSSRRARRASLHPVFLVLYQLCGWLGSRGG